MPFRPFPSLKHAPSLAEVNGSIRVPKSGWRRFLAFLGPGYLISVGYMDPGNWATDIAAGSQFGYSLLFVILLSNLMAVLLQSLGVRLGIGTGLDLAQACRQSYNRPVNVILWLACELAIIACDVAEVIGTAIALQLLFGIPLLMGTLITICDTFLLLLLINRGFRALEAFVITLLLVIMVCFIIQIVAVQPQFHGILKGFIPSTDIVKNPQMLYVAIGIIGATVMPHNLYLHSSIVQTRAFEPTHKGRRQAIQWATVDSTIALTLALVINAAILILASAAFHQTGHTDVGDITKAYHLLAPILGSDMAATMFAIALLAAGLNSTLTATLAGQIVMEGFLNLRFPPWIRRLITRGLAIIPVIIITLLYGDKGTEQLLLFSQVILSMQLPLAIIPLILFATDQKKMGAFVTPRWMAVLAWAATVLIITLNLKLLSDYL
ncbi:Nramp family divalent metal transporter [Candidatus Odyssella thessalonicensis]|uniref:Nramp family divalent metal transporter n=1 Tax=Candidatus Odyssella thessalonicensis TaxID=84647 RepID=UPI000225B752|nr:Nramp family divalent metal transporter [Candidatus Odyssella thessalonicensis]